jgi:hypothetical protein
VDNNLNSTVGWFIDSVIVDKTSSSSGCNEPAQNNLINQAVPFTIGQTALGDICPASDVDYYKFNGAAGTRLTFDIDARVQGSALDSVMQLIGPDKRTVVAENDDQVMYEVKDSQITYTIPATGTYYLRVSPWDHPMAGGANFFYSLRAFTDVTQPTVSLTFPQNGATLPNSQINLTVNAADEVDGSGIHRAVFFWHSPDWDNGQWIKVGEDTNGTDGWSIPFDVTKQPNGTGAAVYVQVSDGAGNTGSTGAWTLKTDNTQAPPPVPVSQLLALPTTTNINAILLQWSATSSGAGITTFEIQYQQNGGAWQDWKPEGLNGTDRFAWFIGELSQSYSFRIRAIDAAGNKETWPAQAEGTIVTLPCSPPADGFEEDDHPGAAKAILMGGDRQMRAFCPAFDEDWSIFQPQAGEVYFLNAMPSSSAAGGVIAVVDSAGNVLAESFPAQLGAPTSLRWQATSNARVWIKVRNLNPLLGGDGVSYQFWVDQGLQIPVPMINP